MNRRIAWIVPVVGALMLMGCSSMGRRGAGTTPLAAEPETAPPGRFAREAVPNSVMLQNQAGSFYRDTPAP